MSGTDPKSKQGLDSLGKRYVHKVFATSVTSLLSFGTQALVSRGLGPVAFGSFSFLTTFFNSTLNFLELGTSVCLYTRLSQRPGDSGLLSFYVRFSILLCAIVLLIPAVAIVPEARSLIWPDQEVRFIFYGAGLGVITWLGLVAAKVADAHALTVGLERARMFHRLVGLVIVAALWVAGTLNLTTFFICQYAVLGLFAVLLFRVVRQGPYLPQTFSELRRTPWRPYLPDFYVYSRPLVVNSLVAFVVTVSDRWILQSYGGSAQQGFYGFSYQIGALCFLFSGAMTPLLTREFAIAHGEANAARLGELFRRFIPALYSVAAVLSCFVAINAKEIVVLLGGEAYASAFVPVAIMAMYPAHQTYGQLSSSIYYATDRTKIYSNISILAAVLSVPITFFFVAPKSLGGLDLGATGLALKMVFVQVLIINILLVINTRYLKMGSGFFLVHQLTSVGAFLAAAWAAKWVFDFVLGPSAHQLVHLGLAGILYAVLVTTESFLAPYWTFGLSRQDLKQLVKALREKASTFRRNRTS